MEIRKNFEHLYELIAQYAVEFGRRAQDIRLLAVSKTKPVETIEAALACGQRAFGENYLQEALPKITALTGRGLEWHFIGRIQSNKTRDIAEHFDWVQTVAREKIAQRLNDQRPVHMPPLNVCIQVNVDEEPQKAGALPEGVTTLAGAIAAMPRLRLRGLMAIPEASNDFETQRRSARLLRECFEALQAQGYSLDTLSIGMSDDLRAAIAEGSTMVRIGTALFGARG